jgi:hypothetical protein
MIILHDLQKKKVPTFQKSVTWNFSYNDQQKRHVFWVQLQP